jgi:hypothetical protein
VSVLNLNAASIGLQSTKGLKNKANLPIFLTPSFSSLAYFVLFIERFRLSKLCLPKAFFTKSLSGRSSGPETGCAPCGFFVLFVAGRIIGRNLYL